MRHITLVIAVLALAVAAPAIADKGGSPHGGGNNSGGNDGGGGPSWYTGTLSASPDVLHAGDYFDVGGCGYNTEYGDVVVGFTGGSWGSRLDGNGCFSVQDIPALSGDTLPPGTYHVTAYQYVNGKLRETGDTTVTVVS
jgi:hypothetical protein